MPLYITVRKATAETVAAALKIAGSQAKLAKEFGVTQQAISFWLSTGNIPSARWEQVIQFATGETA